MRLALAAIGLSTLVVGSALVAGNESFAQTNSDTLDRNSDAVVYVEAKDSSGGVLDHGTGFVVSHDGYVVTAAHLDANDGRQLFAVVGARNGVVFPLNRRGVDALNDVLLLQLPATGTCRRAVTLSKNPVHALDPILAVGFPGTQTMSSAPANIANVSSDIGFIKADGLFQPGLSGAPVFNEHGQVIGLVEGGVVTGAQDNDVVPIAPAIALLQQRGVAFGQGAPVPFDTACYATCRNPANGTESWGKTERWGPISTGWLGGGHNADTECDNLSAGTLASRPGAQVEFDPGRSGKSEQSKKDVLGHVEYQYTCTGTLRSQPVYVEARSQACGLR